MLTKQQHATLEFEGKWWRFAGNKEAAIREQFGLSPTRYYCQLLQGCWTS
nr:DUF3263 domain-containing protein [Jongsikchunia kroppenstedtii]